jgi:hypothetical protein
MTQSLGYKIQPGVRDTHIGVTSQLPQYPRAGATCTLLDNLDTLRLRIQVRV